jgi:hypothetical protein
MHWGEDVGGYVGYVYTMVEYPWNESIGYSLRSTQKVYVEYYDYYEDEWGNPIEYYYFDDFFFSWYNGQGLDIIAIVYPRQYPDVLIGYQYILLGAVVADFASMASGIGDTYKCNSFNQFPAVEHCWYLCTNNRTGFANATAWHIDIIRRACGYLNPPCPASLDATKILWGSGPITLLRIDRCYP